MFFPLCGVNDISSENVQFALYPNPAKGESTLEFNSEAKGFADIRITDIVGQEVAVLFSGEINAGRKQIKINENKRIAAGTYFVKATINGSSGVKKLIIE